MSLDLAFVRSQFPALARLRLFRQCGWLPGAAQCRRAHLGVSPDHERADRRQLRAFATGDEPAREARAKIARLLGAARPEEIVLGPSTTVLAQFLSRAMEGRLKPGDEIVVTNFDHESKSAHGAP